MFGIGLFLGVNSTVGELEQTESMMEGSIFSGLLAGPLPMLVLIFGVFYFLLIRPQQKKVKVHREMLSGLNKGNNVLTSGGIYGKITSIDDQIVILEISPQVKVKVNRSSISGKFEHNKKID